MNSNDLSSAFICEARIELAPHAPVALGRSPWRNRRISDIRGGVVQGPRFNGRVRESGADWSEGGRTDDGDIITAVDVRSLWESDDGALVYVCYQGRLVIPQALAGKFADPSQVESIPAEDYYFRIAPVFETASPQYQWLNAIVAVGQGRRTPAGVTYRIFEVL